MGDTEWSPAVWGMSGGTVTSQTVWIDLTSGQSHSVGSLVEARAGHRMVSYSGSVLAVGGWDGDTVLGSVEEWVAHTQSWVTTPHTTIQPRCYFSAVNVPLSTDALCH